MKINRKIIIMLSVFSLIIFGAAAAFGASLIISPAGNGVFTLQGIGLANVGGIDATIRYDTSTLANPRVALGGLASGALMAANTNNPGTIIIGLISTKGFSGTGAVATVNFDTLGGSSGKIISMTAKVINTTSSPLAVQTRVVNPVETTDSSPGTGETASTGTTQSGGETASQTEAVATPQTTTPAAETGAVASGPAGRILGAGTVTMPSETVDMAKQPETGEAIVEGQAGETPAETMAEQESPEVMAKADSPEQKHVAYKSVLERFREFDGEKTPASLTTLFAVESMPGIRQEPAIVLSDGKTKVKIIIQLPYATKEAPNFSVRGAKLVSLKKEGAAWALEVLPENRVYEASITVLNNGSTTEIPLTVAPSLDAISSASAKLDVAGFTVFLKETGTDKAPLNDLNGDKVRNYIDDYIYTANYLVKRESTKKAKGK